MKEIQDEHKQVVAFGLVIVITNATPEEHFSIDICGASASRTGFLSEVLPQQQQRVADLIVCDRRDWTNCLQHCSVWCG